MKQRVPDSVRPRQGASQQESKSNDRIVADEQDENAADNESRDDSDQREKKVTQEFRHLQYRTLLFPFCTLYFVLCTCACTYCFLPLTSLRDSVFRASWDRE